MDLSGVRSRKARVTEAGWLSGMDSNHDKELQRLLCYHYTTGQGPDTVTFRALGRNRDVGGFGLGQSSVHPECARPRAQEHRKDLRCLEL